ncbi:MULTISPECIES: hypothetical protein [unclassified Mesorhizobium]|uniref:hypothetical protein n=1 Tax=unclassified Mesorhizobium TaxID=325217 RepID=UPI00112D20DA|nr:MULTISPECIES: hypothetical protein [unclassified Mesorhizobium]TPJ47450.1 hypothetical protein FJ437_11220 [Mesorhizobium sp. B2-6-6]MBZ9699622.1 hypothetical protein [Mesorhizobium sp. CO1-1-3]MBZ9945874.1 hypothetical protein [Mesorhizobium sp. BR1-1-11]MBZ9999865.1 hypothetical protein [Mesorhizobium sp. B264B2A]MCA0005659.1 hypothetical protein [Mesorhizobium sp. B264B1B]
MNKAIIILAALTLALPAHAQSQNAPLPPDAPAPEAVPGQTGPDQGITGQTFTNIAIVALADLPPDLKAKVETVVAQTSQEDLHVLQRSVSASPEASSVLAANGLDASEVVAANIDGDGTLTLIIQTTT